MLRIHLLMWQVLSMVVSKVHSALDTKRRNHPSVTIGQIICLSDEAFLVTRSPIYSRATYYIRRYYLIAPQRLLQKYIAYVHAKFVENQTYGAVRLLQVPMPVMPWSHR